MKDVQSAIEFSFKTDMPPDLFMKSASGGCSLARLDSGDKNPPSTSISRLRSQRLLP